ncbi:MAG: acetyl-CoA C-acyltransferase, partial [Bacteroidia bacterium]|nr:acetyl-CoA C-acyltransferase [Bacteroidia bacterium]
MQNAYIINGVRTPIGNFGGSLSSVRTDDLAALVIKKLIEKNPSVDVSQITEIILGCANQAGEDNRNVARMALLLAGLPVSVPAETVNRLCASGLSASMNAARQIMTGDADIIIAGGVENMTRAPWVISKTSAAYGRDAQMYDSSFGWRFVNPKMKEVFGIDSMGETAENLTQLKPISREDQDALAFRSQMKASEAKKKGRFAKEIIPVEIQNKKTTTFFEHDEFMKAETTQEILAKLKPAFRKEGSVTAGNSAGLNDGAAAILLASETGIKKYNLKPLAKIISSAAVGVEPCIMGIGPVEASNRALTKANLKMSDMDVIELN